MENRDFGNALGIVFILVAPSGGGKSTICKRLLRENRRLAFSISLTTRPPRPGECDGVDYFFVSKEQFKEKIARGEFLECAEVHGQLYGTDRRLTESLLKSGRDVLLDIDVQGAESVKRAMPGCVRIFILPPCREELVRRLRDRGTDSEKELSKRIANAAEEISHCRDYDYIVVNDDLETAYTQIRSVLISERVASRHGSLPLEGILRSFNLQV